MEELPVGLAVGGDGLCMQCVGETVYAQGGEAVMSDDGIGIGGFEHHGDQGNARGYANFLSSSPIKGNLVVGGDESCAQCIVETAYVQGGEAVMSVDGFGGFENAIGFSSVIKDIRVDSIDTNDSLPLHALEMRQPSEETRPPPKKMPKTKKKFGHGVVRGGNKKQGREISQAITSVARGLIDTTDSRPSIKHITKAQLSKSLVASEVRTVLLFFNL